MAALIPPSQEPDESPTRALLINANWCTYLIGLVENVSFQTYWDVTDAEWDVLQGRLNNLIVILTQPD